jgi:hypothetical protein
MSFEGAMCLPWSLRSVAGALRTAWKIKPATPVGMTESEKRREEKRRAQHRLKPVLLGWVRFG